MVYNAQVRRRLDVLNISTDFAAAMAGDCGFRIDRAA
jgi:hypothetical protein